MIIKSMTRKTASFKQLLIYMNKPAEKEQGIVLQNLLSGAENPEGLLKEFLENFRYLRSRRGGVVLYHEVLSLAEADRKNITPAILEDLGAKYLEQRAPQALAYGAAHFNKSSPHLHLMISANQIESPKKIRLSRKQFEKIKKDLEAYQKEKYPFLSHSLAFEKEKREKRISSKEQERKRRIEGQEEAQKSRKELVRDMVLDCLERADSQEEFLAHLEQAGLRHYRRGKTEGVTEKQKGKKYRFKTLGIGEEYRRMQNLFLEVKKNKTLLAEKEREEKNKSRIQDMQNGFREKFRKLLEPVRIMGRTLSQKLSPLFQFWGNSKKRQKEGREREQ